MRRFYWIAAPVLFLAFLVATRYFCAAAQSVEGFGAYGLVPIVGVMLAIASLSLILGLYGLAAVAESRPLKPLNLIPGLLLLAPAGFWIGVLAVRQYTEALSICTPYGL